MADFFDKMKDGFNKGVATISEGSKNFTEKAKLNTAIKEAESERKQLCELLGQQMYRLHKEGTQIPEELLNFCSEISIREQKIEEFKLSIQALEEKANIMQNSGVIGGVQCSVCGFSNKPEASFCTKCGNRIK